MFNVYDYLERKLPVQCIAHRGFSGLYPENTLLSFNEAIKLNADLIEFDVRVCGDGVAVVVHDASVDRTTDGSGLVSRLGLEELRRLDAGLGERIPTLTETLDLVAGKIGLNIHVKIPGKLVDYVVKMIREYDIVESAFIALEDREDIIRVRKIYPDIHICSLYRQREDDYLEVSKLLGVKILQPYANAKYFTKEWMDSVHRENMVAGVFWANNFTEVRNVLNKGVDGILSDFPNVCQRYREVIGRKLCII